MPLTILLLVLFSSVLHASWNYLAKTVPGGGLFVWLLAMVMGVILLPFAVAQIWFFGFEWTFVNVMALLVTGVLHTVYFLVLQKGYQEADLSVVYPLARGTGPVFSGMGAVLFLQEVVRYQDIAGFVFVGAGAVVIGGLSLKQLWKPALADEQNNRILKGLFYGIFTGLLIACYTIFDGYCVTRLALAPILIEYTAHPLRFLVLLPMALKRRTEAREIWRHHWLKILTIAIVSPFAFILVLYAMKSAPIHAVAPVREFSIVIGVLLGARLLAEEQVYKRLAGSVLIMIGIALLAAP